ncbi:hypothetical protein CERSUDRAFT_122743 [Gelatoporia subvermispora B]|uniref:Fungal-type protein kinase domain-containing protein n=1 Tax=Ceriporiopsis subvermispora (strain B) TaxID=914234 RepID=M2PRV7_CERS8|nr:hypothetical protein CERSUDRAFT_122743 [Gelatoporia subvermispora B]
MGPTVHMLNPMEAERWQKSTGHSIGTECPAYEVFLGGPYNQRWITIGVPVYNSVSLLGRGTLVWNVFNVFEPHQYMTMKDTWRRARRSPEAQTSNFFPNKHPHNLVGDIGSDVYVHSNGPECVDRNHVVLHRLSIEKVGRPLWEYRSELELLRAIRAVLAGHQYLCQHHILHRGISIGNVLLADTDSPELRGKGFVIDLDFALDSGPSNGGQQWGNIEHGAAIMGTLPFMAQALLEYTVSQEHPPAHEPKHEIESFIWILCYAILRRLSEPHNIRTGRGPLMMTNVPEICCALSTPTTNMLKSLSNMLVLSSIRAVPLDTHAQRFGTASFTLTHLAVLAVFDNAITALTSLACL